MMEVIKVEDLIKAIESLPNCPNGFSDVYDKNRILLQIRKIPKYEVLQSNIELKIGILSRK
ncbi:MAG: hypothetical protein HDQ99_02630 [Lachnospiraceae bacterium]|nr:hypothetical protein [Lachnospiraceae bacterium]